MDPQRDTPIKRFSALWVGLFIALSFLIATFIVGPMISNREVTDEALQAEYDARLKVKADVDKAQAEQLSSAQPESAYAYTAKQLLNGTPQATKQLVPGSPTDIKLNTVK